MISNPKHIIISRTDSIGDVCLTLPLAGILKEKFKDVRITFLGMAYTKPVIECCPHVDEIVLWSDISAKTQVEQIQFLKQLNADVFIHVFPKKEIARLVKKAGIKHRIGTSHRFFHWLTCNHRPSFTRKNSDLHESQLNTKLLLPFDIKENLSLAQLYTYTNFRLPEIKNFQFDNLLKKDKVKIILHPKSQGSAREWSIENFIQLAKDLDEKKYDIFFTGTEKEGALFRELIPIKPNVFDLSGKMTLSELILFISKCDILIAASTGPLHLAGLSGIHTIGLFSTQRPTHAGRWQPLGNKVQIIEEENFISATQPLNIPLRELMKVLKTTTL